MEKDATSKKQGSKRWLIAQAAEIRWWKRYLKRQDPNEYLPRKRTYWLRFLSDCGLPLPPEGTQVLDAGCGPAGIFMALPHCNVTATDPLLSAYKEHLSTFFQTSWYPNVQFEQQALETMSVGQFPLVYCLNAINHVDNLDIAIATLVQSVHVGGTLVLSTDVHVRKWVRDIFRLAPGDILHPQQHVIEEYQEKLTQLGMKIQGGPIVVKEGNLFNYCVLICKKES